MSGKYRAVALQAVGVAVLAVIVYIAFLRPSDPNPLNGITGPDAAQQANNPGGDSKKHHGTKPHRKPGKTSKGDRGGGTSVERPGQIGGGNPSATGGQSTGSEDGSQPPDSSGEAEPPGPDTPPGSQYEDTVARILAKLNE